jgi:hypothetical protein
VPLVGRSCHMEDESDPTRFFVRANNLLHVVQGIARVQKTLAERHSAESIGPATF